MKQHNYRPPSLEEFVGQRHIVSELTPEIMVAKHDHTKLNNRIFYGPPGLGKTSLTAAIAAEAGVTMHILTGKEATLERITDVLANVPVDGYETGTFRDNPNAGRVKDPSRIRTPIIFLDEIDGVSRQNLQLLHPLMEGRKADGSPHVFEGVDEYGEDCTIWLPDLCFVAATNYLGDLVKADRAILSRFSHPMEFRPYNCHELAVIIKQFASKSGVEISTEAAELIAQRSRDVPRNATNLLKEAWTQHRYAQIRDGGASSAITPETVERTFELKGIDKLGLDEVSRQYLRVIGSQRKMGLEAIADHLGLDARSVEWVIEPYIRRLGLAEKGSGGRWITDAGREAVGLRGRRRPTGRG